MTDQISQTVIRKEVLAVRRTKSTQWLEEESRKTVNAFVDCLKKKTVSGLKIALYRSLPEELSIKPLEEFFIDKGATLYFPRVRGRHIQMIQLDSALGEEQWSQGAFGIQELKGEVVGRPDEIDVIFVPGVAFDRLGTRVGFGKGFYDRYLSTAQSALRISLVFDLQISETLIMRNSWDEKIDWIFSYRKSLENRRGNAGEIWK